MLSGSVSQLTEKAESIETPDPPDPIHSADEAVSEIEDMQKTPDVVELPIDSNTIKT